MTKKQVLDACKELNKTSLDNMENDRCMLNVPALYEEEEFIIQKTPARMILPGLAITKIVDLEDEKDHPPVKYGFTHTESGRKLPFGHFKSERSALIKANKCKVLKEIDWCEATYIVSTDPKFREITNYFMK